MALIFSGLSIPPAQSLIRSGRSASERQLTVAALQSALPVVYGRDRLGGLLARVMPASSGSSMLVVNVFWCVECDGIEDFRLNDQPLPAGYSVTHYNGSQTSPDPTLVAAMSAQGISFSASLNGVAHSVLLMPIRDFSGQINCTATIRGRRVYDPRKDSTVAGGSGPHRLNNRATYEWSDVPDLALADAIFDSSYGAGEPVVWTSVIAAANHSDAMIGTPAERRRTVGISFQTPTETSVVIDTLRAHAGCFVVPRAEGRALLPDADGSIVAAYSHSAGTIAAIDPLVLRDSSELPTVVEVIYTDTSKLPWRDGRAVAALPGAGSTRPYRLQQIRMPGVQRYSQALREATERLNKLTLIDMTTSVEVYDIGIAHEIGDLISLSHPVGLANKAFRIAAAPLFVAPGRWRLPLVEHDPNVYSTSVVSVTGVADTSLISPLGPPPTVVGVTTVIVPGAVRIQIPAKPVSDIDAIEIRVGASWAAGTRLEDGAPGSTSVDGTVYDWAWPAAGTYTLRFRWRDRDGNLSSSDSTLGLTITAGSIQITEANAASGLRNSQISLSASGGTIALVGAGGGSASGVIMPGNPVTSGNVSTYVGDGAIPNAQVNLSISVANRLINSGPAQSGALRANGRPIGWDISWDPNNRFQQLFLETTTWRPAGFEVGSAGAFFGSPVAANGLLLGDIRLCSESSIFCGIEPSKRYQFSVYLSAHRCAADVRLVWVDANANYITENGGNQVAQSMPPNTPIDSWPRSFVIATPPNTARMVLPIIRVYGIGQTDPFLFASCAMFAEATVNQTVPSPWSPGVTGAALDGEMIRGQSITANRIQVNELSALTANIGLLRNATSGARFELASTGLRIFDAAGVRRIRVGDLS